MPRRRVLISGAGIAGSTLAYWLARHGYSVSVIERSTALRSSGAPVDVRGPAADVAERMGITARLRQASSRIAGLSFLEASGRTSVRVDLEAARRSLAPKDIELPRGDLANILHEASRDSAEYIFGDSIASLANDSEGVAVTFEPSKPRRFDLVIGADGLHSNVRRLAFGPESRFVRFVGLYVATLPLPANFETGREMIILNVPERCVAVHPSRDEPLALLLFWSDPIGGLRPFDGEQHQRILDMRFGDLGWKVPQILQAVRAASDLYFDSVSRVEIKDWTRGRVALLGDAAACVSLFGDGSTLAMAGAYTLAAALAEHPADYRQAFRQYQAEHGKFVASRQRSLRLVARLVVPRTAFGIGLRNQLLVRMIAGLSALKRGLIRSA